MGESGGDEAGEAGAHIILVGLPGAGKSTAGRMLASRLGRPFLDMDEEIVRRTRRTVAEIFEHEGEAAFRSRERMLTEELRGAAAQVVAPGGGWMTVPGLAALLRPPSKIVYLRISPAGALHRLGAGVADRPLLRGESPLSALTRLHALRDGIYSGADVILDVEHHDPQWVMESLLRLASPAGRG